MDFKYYIDQKKFRIKPAERYIRVNGWCFEKNGEPFTYESVVNGKVVESRIKKIVRPDVQNKFGGKYSPAADTGFHIKTMSIVVLLRKVIVSTSAGAATENVLFPWTEKRSLL